MTTAIAIAIAIVSVAWARFCNARADKYRRASYPARVTRQEKRLQEIRDAVAEFKAGRKAGSK